MTEPEERRIKHERVIAYLDDHQLDGVLLRRRCNFSWYTCGGHNHVAGACDAGNSYVFVDRLGGTVLANNVEAARLAGEELADADLAFETFDYYHPAGRAEVFERVLGRARVAADAPVPGRDLPRLDADFDRLRWSLTPWEVERYRGTCSDSVAAMESAARAAVPGMTEHELAGEAGRRLLAAGCTPWLLLVGADDRIARYRHPLPTGRRAERSFMLVTCAERDGLIAAVTRLGHFGPVPEELAARHRAAATVNAALLAALRPGVTLGTLFAEAQEAFAEVGHPDEWRELHVGGSCGYLPRERKAATGDSTQALENQAFAWNPSLAGSKCEDTVLCGADGWRALSAATDWPEVEVAWRGESCRRPGILSL
mgnify:CR=1 FL=1